MALRNAKPVRVIFQDGQVFHGRAFALSGDRYAEVVFNTGMTGYQEILTDPSYKGQAVVMTYPLIGSYGINEEDSESHRIFLEALLVKEYIPFPSNWRSGMSLKDYLTKHDVLGVEGLDTRAMTRYIREKGACKAAITTYDGPVEMFTQRLGESSPIFGVNMVHDASCERSYRWPKPDCSDYRIAVLDCGIKHNILRLLYEENMDCTVFNSVTHIDRILNGDFDGVFISNGPGDPEYVYSVTELVKRVIGKIPIFGICLGHQILGQALGAKTFKLKFGHHGVNHPVKNLRTGQIEITSQNHNFAIDPKTLPENVEVTHVNLNDHTVSGIRHKTLPAFSVQYHPESAPGPHDSRYLFKEFYAMVAEHHAARQSGTNTKYEANV